MEKRFEVRAEREPSRDDLLSLRLMLGRYEEVDEVEAREGAGSIATDIVCAFGGYNRPKEKEKDFIQQAPNARHVR